jgi:hypothetical protein
VKGARRAQRAKGGRRGQKRGAKGKEGRRGQKGGAEDERRAWRATGSSQAHGSEVKRQV